MSQSSRRLHRQSIDFGIAKLDEPEQHAASEEKDAPLSVASEPAAATPATEFPTLINLHEGQTSRAPRSGEQSEVATQLPPLRLTTADLSEAGTLIRAPAAADVSEAGTRLLPAEDSAKDMEAGTRILEERATDKHLGMHTGSSSSLTRVGAILGTPLYMSPEQCRGETLDARSDIYSLGVIAYRLLSGRTPFGGTQTAVMKMHCEEPPPPLAVKRVPKKVTALVMSALAKKREERPPGAAAFASALRAHATGTGTLLRHALTLYSEHLPTFLRLAVLVYWPVVLMTFVKVVLMYLAYRHIIGEWAANLASVLTVIATFFSASVMVGVTTWLVTQVLAVPLRPLLLRPAFEAMRKRLRPFMLTTILSNLLCLIGIVLFILPGLYLIANFSMVAPVVMMEDLRGRPAMKRSRALYKRSRRTVVAIMFIHFGAPSLVSVISALLIVAVVKLFNKRADEAGDIVKMAQSLVALPTTVLFSSIAAVVSALLYWKTRLAGGETMAQALLQFAEEEAATGQGSIRTRFGTSMRTSRQSGQNRLR